MENIQRDGLNGSSEKIKDAFVDVKGSLKETGKQVSSSAMKVVSELESIGKDTFKDISTEGKKHLSTAEKFVRAYPIRSVLFGAAVGVFLSKIIRN